MFCGLLSKQTRVAGFAGKECYVIRNLLIGYVIVVAWPIYGAILTQVPIHWIVVGALVLLGPGILTGVKATRQQDFGT